MHDAINHPSHYTDGKIEVIDFIEDKQLGYHLGNAIKYISRAGKKDPSKTVEDLKKAVWYINRKISKMESGVDIIEQRIIADEQMEAKQRETHEQLVSRALKAIEKFCQIATDAEKDCTNCFLSKRNNGHKLPCCELCQQHPQLALDLMESATN